MIDKICKNCELYYHCKAYKTLPPKEDGCIDWEIAFNLYQNATRKEQKEIHKDWKK